MREHKIYTIAGVRWIQRELTRGEFVKAISKRENLLEDIKKIKTFAEALEYINENILDDLYGLILKPYSENWREALRSFFIRLFKFLMARKLPNYQTFNEIAEVLQDFFTMNTRFIQNFGSMASVSDLTLKTETTKPESDSPTTS